MCKLQVDLNQQLLSKFKHFFLLLNPKLFFLKHNLYLKQSPVISKPLGGNLKWQVLIMQQNVNIISRR